MNARLGGACQVPVAGHAVFDGERLRLTGLVGAPDGSMLVRDTVEGMRVEAALLGERLAQRLLDAGARTILAPLGIHV